MTRGRSRAVSAKATAGARRGRAAADRQPNADRTPTPTPTSPSPLNLRGDKVKVPFPKKNQPPSETEFLARLPLATGKKFETVRTFLKKQKGVAEDLYYYGPKTGWAFRYLRGAHSLATIMIHDGHLMGIVSLDSAARAHVDFGSLSEVGQRAAKMAHGSPALLWLDLPLDATGATDFRTLLRAKLKRPPPPRGPLPPPPPPAAVK